MFSEKLFHFTHCAKTHKCQIFFGPNLQPRIKNFEILLRTIEILLARISLWQSLVFACIVCKWDKFQGIKICLKRKFQKKAYSCIVSIFLYKCTMQFIKLKWHVISTYKKCEHIRYHSYILRPLHSITIPLAPTERGKSTMMTFWPPQKWG